MHTGRIVGIYRLHLGAGIARLRLRIWSVRDRLVVDGRCRLGLLFLIVLALLHLRVRVGCGRLLERDLGYSGAALKVVMRMRLSGGGSGARGTVFLIDPPDRCGYCDGEEDTVSQISFWFFLKIEIFSYTKSASMAVRACTDPIVKVLPLFEEDEELFRLLRGSKDPANPRLL